MDFTTVITFIIYSSFAYFVSKMSENIENALYKKYIK